MLEPNINICSLINLPKAKSVQKTLSLAVTVCLAAGLIEGAIFKPVYAATTNRTRVLTRSFTGVRSCDDASRQSSEANAEIRNFLNKQFFPSYQRSWRFLERRYNNHTAWDGKRSCSGWIKIRLNYYIVSKNFKICNRKDSRVVFRLKRTGSSRRQTISPGYCRTYTRIHPDTYIDFDGSTRPKYQRVTYALNDKRGYYFEQNGREIDLRNSGRLRATSFNN